MTYIRNKKQFAITKENRERILQEIDDLANLRSNTNMAIT